MKTMLFVMNPFAGTRKANRYLANILSTFNQAGYTVITHMTSGPGDCTAVVERMASKVDTVVCCGGDGTFNETVNGLLRAGIDIPIGYIPAGSTNDFAASLHLPLNPLKAAQAIAMGRPRRYDIGQFGDRYFSYVASFGAFTKSSYATPQYVKNALGHTAYLFSGLHELSHLRNIHMRLELDEEIIEGDFLFGAISNSTSLGGVLSLDPELVDMQDGKFELMLMRMPKNLSEWTECIQALQSHQYNCSAITFRNVSHLTVSSTEAVAWTLDGERADPDGPVEVRNMHHAISLLQKE